MVITDGGGSLPKGFDGAYDVTVVPLSITFGTATYRSDVDLDMGRFYQMLEGGPHHPTTSQPTPADFVHAYEKVRDQGHQEVFSIHMSSNLSGTFNSASQAASHVEGIKIHLLDTHTLSMAQGFQVMVAAAGLRAGLPSEKIFKLMEQTKQESDLFFTLDTLDYLVKGGRIGRVKGMMGSLLGIKPIIVVDKGQGIYTPAGTGRTLKKAMQTMVDKAVELTGGVPSRYGVLYANSLDLATEVEAMVRARGQVAWLQTQQISQTLAVHTGPRGVGLAVAKGPWPEGLGL